MVNVFPGILYVVDNIDNIAGAINNQCMGGHAVLNVSEDISSTPSRSLQDITQRCYCHYVLPIATYMEIDNSEGFKQCYTEYLFNDK